MNQFRSFLYTLAKILGDINAIQKGTIGKRVYNRAIGKAMTRFFK